MGYCISGVYSTQAVNALNDDAFYSKYYFHATYCKNALRNIVFLFSWSYHLICSFQGAKFVRTRKLCSLLLRLFPYGFVFSVSGFVFSVSSRTKGCIGESILFENVCRYTNEANIELLFSAISFVKSSQCSSVGNATTGVLTAQYACIYRGADKSLARLGRKQAPKHVRDARDFNKIETRAVIKFLFLQGKAPKEIDAILTETLACFLPGRAKDLSAPPIFYGLYDRQIGDLFLTGTSYFSPFQTVQTGAGDHPGSCNMGTGVSYPEDKTEGAWGSPLISVYCVD